MARHRTTPHGFTLIELMVTVTICAIVVAGLTRAMIDLDRTFSARRLVTAVQGEGRAGVNRLQDDLRHGSLGSALGVVIANTPAGVAQRPAVQIFDNVPGGTAWLPIKPGTDAVLVVAAKVRTYDVAQQEFRSVQAAVNLQNFDPVAQPLAVTDVGGFEIGQYVLVGPGKTAGWSGITLVNGTPGQAGTLQLDGTGGNILPDGHAEVGSTVRAAFSRLYFVNTRDEMVALDLRVPYAPQLEGDIIRTQTVATGVENLQVNCRLDGGGWFQPCPGVLVAADPIAGESVASGLAGGAGGGPRIDAQAIGSLRAVSLSVVARSRTPVRGQQTGDPTVAVENQVALAPDPDLPDPNAQYARRAYRIEVSVRNTSLGVL
jgi:prepilin-type N-terminal cleavage/methylation domain-containing protein